MSDKRKDDFLILKGIVDADETSPDPVEVTGRVFEHLTGRINKIVIRLDKLERRC